MAAGGETPSNQTSVWLEEHVGTALWGRVSPEGPFCFRGGPCRPSGVVKEPLRRPWEQVKQQDEADLKNGSAAVPFPDALGRKEPNGEGPPSRVRPPEGGEGSGASGRDVASSADQL